MIYVCAFATWHCQTIDLQVLRLLIINIYCSKNGQNNNFIDENATHNNISMINIF